ncbi:MAG TPA: glycosyltransferase family 1 protein [Streptosporangiaceae bacterium]|nr:glycosyltransferase family 1 protein [Streptosporangiaceae bacterium]
MAHSVLRIAEHLVARGHQPLVIAPRPAAGVADADAGPLGFPVIRVNSMPLPAYRGFRLGLASAAIYHWLHDHRADLVHLASPFFLGAPGGTAARRLRLPAIAVYQTDVPAYARAYHWGGLAEAAAWRWLRRIHNAADRTLAPSTASVERLREHGIQRVWRWGRGVDCQRFAPAARSDALRRSLAPGGEVLVGYVGRLATEKRVDLLAKVATLPGARLIIVGSGPAEARLRRLMPAAVFLGQQGGDQLARIFASLDVFVHSGCHETFGQTIQEAAASGLPVVAPAVGGPVDLVDDGVTGYLVPPGDAAALTAATARLVADPVARAAQGRAARQRVLARSWAALGDALIEHYAEVLAAGRLAERTAVPEGALARPGLG